MRNLYSGLPIAANGLDKSYIDDVGDDVRRRTFLIPSPWEDEEERALRPRRIPRVIGGWLLSEDPRDPLPPANDRYSEIS